MKYINLALLILLLSACSAIQLKQGAEKVRLTNFKPSDGCIFLGDITGSQGNFISGKWTSNANLETGARNDLKNQALSMGGNVVVILTQRAGITGDQYNETQTNVTVTGNVYRCPNE